VNRKKSLYGTLLYVVLSTALTTANAKVHVYKYTRADGSVVFSDLKPKTSHFQTLKFDCYACNVHSLVDWKKTPLYKKYTLQIANASTKYGLDKALIRAVIHAESSFNPHAISKVGAQGLMQLMPATAKELGVKKPMSVIENIDGGTRYLKKLLDQFGGNISHATAAYNAGPSTVKKYNGIPPYKETKAYVRRIGILYKRYQNQ